MDRTGVASKRGRCQISFVYEGKRYRPVLGGLSYGRATDRKAAAQILANVHREIDLGKFDFARHFPKHPDARRFLRGHQIKVGEALTDWLQSKRSTIEATTYSSYQKDVVFHLLPNFGHLRLSELATAHVESWLKTLDNTGKTKNNILIPLRSVMKRALQDELIEKDPLRKIPYYTHRARQADPFSTIEIQAILDASEGQCRNIIQFAFGSGLRTSELIAVRWEDVDFEKGKIHVRMTRTSEGERHRGKTATSMRPVDMNAMSRAALTAQLEYTRSKLFVFDNPNTGRPWLDHAPLRRTAWRPALVRAGVRYRCPYQTRHTFASRLLSCGAAPMYVAQQMGHRDWGMIRKVYGRWLPEYSEAQQDKIVNAWEPWGNLNNAGP